MGLAADAIRIEDTRVDIVRSKYFFSQVSVETTPMEFSYEVHNVCDNTTLSLEEKQTILTNPVRMHTSLLTEAALVRYIDNVYRDVFLLTMMLKCYSALPIPNDPDMEPQLDHDSLEAWTIAKMICVLERFAPDDLPAFEAQLRKRFGKTLRWWMLDKLEHAMKKTQPEVVPVLDSRVSIIIKEMASLPKTKKNLRLFRSEVSFICA